MPGMTNGGTDHFPSLLSARPLVGRRLALAGTIVLGIAIAVSFPTASSLAAMGSTLLRRGALRSDRWAVAANSAGGRAVCIGAAVGGLGNVQIRESEVCGDVKPSRLVITSQVAPQRKHPGSSITVVGGVFAQSVRSVEFLTEKQSTGIRRRLAEASIGGRRYRYLAFAMPGEWCPDAVITRGKTGEELAHGQWTTVSGQPCE